MTTQLVSNLSEWSALHSADVEQIIRSAPRRYKVFSIPKRGGGLRIVAQPSRELKALQTHVVHRVLHSLPIHAAAHGYVKGRGIKTNAAAHVTSDYILKMDFVEFFPSLRPQDLRVHLQRHPSIDLSEVEQSQLFNIIFWKPKGESQLRLCIGAPSSPFVSNTLMFDLDSNLSAIAERFGVVYSRYADDLTFSSSEKGVLGEVQRAVVEQVTEVSSPRLRVNQRKTVHISRAQRRMVTGIVIDATGNLSLGRDRKRLIRAMVHRRTLNQLDHEQSLQLEGLLAFAHDIEPEFARKMKAIIDQSNRIGPSEADVE